MHDPTPLDRRGAGYTLSAYFLWGLFPIYFKTLVAVPALEIIVHRILWSALCVLIVLVLSKGSANLMAALKNPTLVGGLALSGLCVALNWTIFAWAATHDHVLDTSLGYFINPLLSVLLGMVVLRERLRKAQLCAVGLATVGVTILVLRHGTVPWIALGLAMSFGSYGLLRKQIPVDPLTGLFVETLVLAPLALAYWAHLYYFGDSHFTTAYPALCGLLILAGPITTLPLLFFAAGVRRIPLWCVGLLQYIAPSMTFLMAVFLYKEPFSGSQLITFLFIWAGLIVFSIDLWRSRQFTSGTPLEE